MVPARAGAVSCRTGSKSRRSWWHPPGRMRRGRDTWDTWSGSPCRPTSSRGTTGLKGNDVLMVSGTDEHGTPVMVTADREGVSPREIAERYNELIREDLRDLGITYDCFTRTTTQNHARSRQDIFRTLYEHGCLDREDDARRVFVVDRQHAARPVHRRHVPDLRLHRRRAATSATTAATSSIRPT